MFKVAWFLSILVNFISPNFHVNVYQQSLPKLLTCITKINLFYNNILKSIREAKIFIHPIHLCSDDRKCEEIIKQ